MLAETDHVNKAECLKKVLKGWGGFSATQVGARRFKLGSGRLLRLSCAGPQVPRFLFARGFVIGVTFLLIML